MHSIAWTPFVLWGFVALTVVVAVVVLRKRRQPLWLVILGGLGAAVGGYLVGMVVMVGVATALFSTGQI